MMALMDDIEVLIGRWNDAAAYYRAKGSESSKSGDAVTATDYHAAANSYSTAALELMQLVQKHKLVAI